MPKNQLTERKRSKYSIDHRLTAILILLFALKPSHSSPCGLGCLKCDQQSKICSFCDFKHFYYLESKTKTCIRQKIENCILGFELGQCALCLAPFGPDISGRCAKLTETQTVTNCDIYSKGGSCVRCKNGFFLEVETREQLRHAKNDENNESANLKNIVNINDSQTKTNDNLVSRKLEVKTISAGVKQICSGSKLIKKKHCRVFGETKCLLCEEGYFYDEKTNQCTAKNCLSPNQTLACTQCTQKNMALINLNEVLQKQPLIADPLSLTPLILRVSVLFELGVFFDSDFLKSFLNREMMIRGQAMGIEQMDPTQVLDLNNSTHPQKTMSLVDYGRKSRNTTQQYPSIVQIMFPYCRSLAKTSGSDTSVDGLTPKTKSRTLCEKCLTGYIMDQNTKTCKFRPGVIVPNCMVLESKSRCRMCYKGFYLGEDGQCVPVSVFEKQSKNKQVVQRVKRQLDQRKVKILKKTRIILIPNPEKTKLPESQVLVVEKPNPSPKKIEEIKTIKEEINPQTQQIDNEKQKKIDKQDNELPDPKLNPQTLNEEQEKDKKVPKTVSEKKTLEKETPEKETPEKETPEKEISEKVAPKKETPVQVTPVLVTPAQVTPEKDTPKQKEKKEIVEQPPKQESKKSGLHQPIICDSQDQMIQFSPSNPPVYPIQIPYFLIQEPQPIPNKLAPLDLGPEEQIIVQDLEVKDKELSPTTFPNRRSYLLRRIYEYQTPEGNLLKAETVEYLIVFVNGNVYMGHNLNANKSSDLPLNLKEQNLAARCRQIVLQGNRNKPLPVCVECLDPLNYYLKSYSKVESIAKVCSPRIRKTQNCSEYDRFSEKCLKCKDNLYLYEDAELELCTPGVPHCLEHHVADHTIQCAKCTDDFILVAGTCEVKIELKNCKNRQDNSCLSCDEGFLLFGTNCISRMAYSFFKCLKVSDKDSQNNEPNSKKVETDSSPNPLLQTDSCNCGSEGIEIEEYQTCEPINADKCRQYDQENFCIECREGYYFSPSKVCLEGEIPFCKIYASPINGVQICKLCQSTYVLENNSCRSVLQIFSQNCSEADGELCLKCEKGSYKMGLNVSRNHSKSLLSTNSTVTNPEQPNNSAVLSNKNELTVCAQNVFFNAYSGAKDCLVFNPHTTHCQLCKQGLWVDSNGDCSQCDLKTHSIDNRNSHCVVPSTRTAGCELYDGEFCVKCLNTTLPRVLDEKLYTTLTRVYTDRTKNVFSDSAGFVIRECEVKLHDTCSTQHCQNAVRLDSSKACCQKCNHGRTGVWNESDGTFFTKSCEELVQFCDASVTLKEIPIEFSKYLTCHQCLDDRIVQLSLTEGQPQTTCIEKTDDQPELASCLIIYEGECKVCQPKSKSNFKMINQSSTLKLTCEPIPNCDFSETVGICERCKPEFALSSSKKECLPSPIPHCLQLNDQLLCTHCRNSLILRDNQCFAIHQSNCSKFSGANCTQCQRDKLQVTPSDLDPASLILVKLNLRKTDKLTNWQKSLCVAPEQSKLNPQLENCLSYSSPSICTECGDEFILKKFSSDSIKCITDPNTVSNCHRLDKENKCLDCKPGRYLEGDRCFDGQISGCQTYSSQLNCLECNPKFTLLKHNNRQLCFLAHPQPHCLTPNLIQNSKSTKLKIFCQRCDPLFRTKSHDITENKCFPMRVLPNCRDFDPQSGHCNSCDDLFFVNSDFFCQKRLNIAIQHCKQLETNSDSCEVCHSGFALSASKLQCVERKFPVLPGCKIQNNVDFNCSICDNQHFREPNQSICFPVIKKINNCARYASPDLCRDCNKNFILELNAGAQTCVSMFEDSSQSEFQIVPKTIWIEQAQPRTNEPDSQVKTKSENKEKSSSETEKKSEVQIEVTEDKHNSDSKQQNESNLSQLENLTLQKEKEKQNTKKDQPETKNNNVFQIFEDQHQGNESRILLTDHPLVSILHNIADSERILQDQIAPNLPFFCGLCKEGFIFNSNSSKCEEIAGKGCLFGSQTQCQFCRSGFSHSTGGICVLNYQAGLAARGIILSRSLLLTLFSTVFLFL